MDAKEDRITDTDWVARAHALAPLITSLSPRIESERALPGELLSALHEARLFRLLLPRSLGGAELEPAVLVEVIETLAAADGSTAWCVGQASGCAMTAAYLAPDIACEVFGAADAVLAWGASNTTAKAIAVAGGYRVTGTWLFASGNRHAGWLGGHCTVCEPDGTPRPGPDGRPLERTVLFPRSQAAIEDVWQVMGLRGTGSDSYSVADLFVDAAHSITRDIALDRREAGPLYRFTTVQIYAMSFAGVALGLARASLDAYIALAKVKKPHHGQPLRDSPAVQIEVALAEAVLQSARSLLLETARALWRHAVETGELPLDLRARLRLAATYAIRQARTVVETAYTAAGAIAIFDSQPFERRFRDMHAVSQQVQASAAHLEAAGQYFLGLPPSPRL
jgi:alkylation response protein AidB-like acyl-CoA dehydrogenase